MQLFVNCITCFYHCYTASKHIIKCRFIRSIRCSRVTQYQTVTNIFYYFSSKGYCSHCVKKNLVVFSDLFWIIDTRCNPCRIDYINKTNTTILSSNEGYFVFLIHHVLHHIYNETYLLQKLTLLLGLQIGSKMKRKKLLLMEELLLLCCDERIPGFCSTATRFCHRINCSIKGSEVLCCCIYRVDCQLVVDSKCIN